MAKKARIEGAATAKPRRASRHEFVQPAMIAQEEAKREEPPAEAPKLANPVPGDDGEALERIGASFRERFPEDWENIRLCPLQHGIPAMADLLRGRG